MTIIKLSEADHERSHPAKARIAAYDWDVIGSDLRAFGAAVLDKLLTPDECQDISALYPREAYFRSHIHMARHGFGKGEYRYFKYPLPTLVADLRAELYARVAGFANEWNARMNIATRYPEQHSDYLKICHRCGTDASDTAAAAIRTGRLQLSAPGPVRRSRLPSANHRSAVGAEPGFYRRGICADRATTENAKPRRGGAAAAGRRRFIRRSQPAGARHEGRLSRQSASWR